MSQTWQTTAQVMAELERLRAQADASFARVAREHPRAVACRPGCDDCCHALFDLAPVESLALAAAFGRLPRRLRRRVERRCRQAARDYDQVVAQALALGGEERLQLLARARVACPLLLEGRCVLYEQRPITCRLYGIPVAVAGQGRTCGRARFQTGQSYPTADLDQVQARLELLSRALVRLVPGLGLRRRDLARSLALDPSPLG